MKKLSASIAALVLAAAPTAAFANSASIRLVLTVPVQCTLDVLGGSIQDNKVILQVHRSCNTGHDVIVTGLTDDAMGAVSVSYNGDTHSLAGDSYTLAQPERYYDQTDSVVIEASSATPEDMQRLAGSLQLSVVVA
jgi:hypothetical protein